MLCGYAVSMEVVLLLKVDVLFECLLLLGVRGLARSSNRLGTY